MSREVHAGGVMTRRRWLGLGATAAAAGALRPARTALSHTWTGGLPETGSGTPSAQSLRGRILFLTRGSETEIRALQSAMVDTFKQVEPGVDVNHSALPINPQAYHDRLIFLYASGDPPDVWGFGGNYVLYRAMGLILNLSPLIARDRFDMDRFLPGLAETFRLNGRQYGLPQATTFGTLLFYNKALLDAEGLAYPPMDWQDTTWTYDVLLEYALRLTRNAGQPDATYGVTYAPQMPNMPAWNFGGDTYLPEHYETGIASQSTLDHPAAVQGLQFVQDLRWKHRVQGRPGVDPLTGVTFSTGRVAMDLRGGWNFATLSGVRDLAWGVAAAPYGPTSRSGANNKTVTYTDFWFLSPGSKAPDAAWAFMKHVTTPEVQKQYTQLTGSAPTTTAALDAWFEKFEAIASRGELELLIQGANDPKRAIESPDHTFFEWYEIDQYYQREIAAPLLANLGPAHDIVSFTKRGFDAKIGEVFDRWKRAVGG